MTFQESKAQKSKSKMTEQSLKCSCPIYWANAPDESGNYRNMKAKILSTKYEILNNVKEQSAVSG